MPFYERLVAETYDDLRGTIAVPQLQAGLEGTISIEGYVAYLTETYHYVRHIVPLMRAAERRLAHRPELVEALRIYIEDEAGHEDRILDDIEDVGGNPEAVVGSLPLPATQALIDHGFAAVRDHNAAGIFGVIFMVDAISGAFEEHAVRALLEEADCTAELRPDLVLSESPDATGCELASLLDGVADPGEQQVIINTARDMFRLFGAMFAEMPGDEVAKTGKKEGRP